MFSKPGEKLKTYAVVFFVIIVIASIVLAFVLTSYKDYSVYGISYPSLAPTKFHVGPLLAILFGGIFGGYLVCLALSGFGELIVNSDKVAAALENNTEEIQEELPEL